MNTFENNTQGLAPDARDFLGGNYLRKEDLDGPITVTLMDVRSELVQGASRKKLVVAFRELEKPLILNKTNTRRIAEIFRTTDTALWRGWITLYVEHNVEFGGRLVGGIRIQPAAARPVANDGNVVQMPAGDGHAPAARANGRQGLAAVENFN